MTTFLDVVHIPEVSDDQRWFVGRPAPEKDGRLIGWENPLLGPFTNLGQAIHHGRNWLIEENKWGVAVAWRVDRDGRKVMHDFRKSVPVGFYNHGFGDW